MSKHDTSLKVPTCYASCSIGSPTDPLPAKLAAISAAGFDAIELSFPDLLNFAKSHLKKKVGDSDYNDLCVAGEEVKKLCNANGLKILVLQPFSNFEGWPKRSPERRDAFERAEGWIRIMQAVGTDMLQVGHSIPLLSLAPYEVVYRIFALLITCRSAHQILRP